MAIKRGRPSSDFWGLSETVGYVLKQNPQPVLEVLLGASLSGLSKIEVASFHSLVSEALNRIRELAASAELEIWGRPFQRFNDPLQRIDQGHFQEPATQLVEEHPKNGHARGMVVIDGRARFQDLRVKIEERAKRKLRETGAALSEDNPGLIERLRRVHSRDQDNNWRAEAEDWINRTNEEWVKENEKTKSAHISLHRLQDSWSELPIPKFPRRILREVYKEVFS